MGPLPYKVTMSALAESMAILSGSFPSPSTAFMLAPRFRNRQASLGGLEQPLSGLVLSGHTELYGLLYGLRLLRCHFWLLGDSPGFCGSVSRATVCSNDQPPLLLPAKRGRQLNKSQLSARPGSWLP